LQEAIVEYPGDLEDLYLAERRLADIHAGRAGTVSIAEVESDLGLAN
jgi:RHH-type rel operon transcriptional repressor/antitoxin RelB